MIIEVSWRIKVVALLLFSLPRLVTYNVQRIPENFAEKLSWGGEKIQNFFPNLLHISSRDWNTGNR